jgi:hypothetical protein
MCLHYKHLLVNVVQWSYSVYCENHWDVQIRCRENILGTAMLEHAAVAFALLQRRKVRAKFQYCSRRGKVFHLENEYLCLICDGYHRYKYNRKKTDYKFEKTNREKQVHRECSSLSVDIFSLCYRTWNFVPVLTTSVKWTHSLRSWIPSISSQTCPNKSSAFIALIFGSKTRKHLN